MNASEKGIPLYQSWVCQDCCSRISRDGLFVKRLLKLSYSFGLFIVHHLSCKTRIPEGTKMVWSSRDTMEKLQVKVNSHDLLTISQKKVRLLVDWSRSMSRGNDVPDVRLVTNGKFEDLCEQLF